MIRISVWANGLEDEYLRRVTQLGADAIDGIRVPDVPGKGYPDLDGCMRGESVAQAEDGSGPPSMEELDFAWQRICTAYERLVPIAEEYDAKLAMHPSDTPNPDTPFGGLGFHRLIDAFPSRSVGYLYCCGTRAEAGGSSLVLDEINNYGRKGRIFHVHFRNVRGSLATAGAFAEVMLDNGDMNMFRILRALHEVGFDGCLNPDSLGRQFT